MKRSKYEAYDAGGGVTPEVRASKHIEEARRALGIFTRRQQELNRQISSSDLAVLSATKYNYQPLDESAEDMEPALVFVLPQLFPELHYTGKTFSFLASQYDDVFFGTDVVFGVYDEAEDGGKPMMFSIDATTATNPENIRKKFQRSEQREWAVPIKYCQYDNKRWQEEKASHFVLGMSPASLEKLMNGVKTKFGGRLISEYEENTDVSFIILSEMYEQIAAQVSFLDSIKTKGVRGEQIAKLEKFKPMVYSELCRVLEVDTNLEEKTAFRMKYLARRKRLLNQDNTYKSILAETQQIYNQTRGAKTLRAADAAVA